MKEISHEEVKLVSGGVAVVVAGMVGAFFVFGYGVGKDLAERENAN